MKNKEVVYNSLRRYLEPTDDPDRFRARCPLCGDSKKDLKKKRFYIKFNFNNNEPIQYKCFNCDEKGNLNKRVIDSLTNGSVDNNIESLVKEINKSSNHKKVKKDFYTTNVKTPKYNERFDIKKEYIENRLGLKFTYEELKNLKAVLDLYNFLRVNNINEIYVDKFLADKLNRDYVGFLTVLNDVVVFRNITNEEEYKHNKYKIFGYQSQATIYTIPASISVYTKQDIHINLSEGVYDILGVYYHIKDANKTNNLYAAVLNASYLSTIQYFFMKKVIGDNVIINIYSDSDKDENWYKKNMLYRVLPWVKEVNIFYNEIGKDYGVRKDEIKLVKRYSYKI